MAGWSKRRWRNMLVVFGAAGWYSRVLDARERGDRRAATIGLIALILLAALVTLAYLKRTP